jgi:hypothetical protein
VVGYRVGARATALAKGAREAREARLGASMGRLVHVYTGAAEEFTIHP